MPGTIIAEGDIFTQHLTGWGHPESPARFVVSKKALQQHGLLHESNTLPLRLATDQELLLCHTQDYLNEVQKNIYICKESGIIDGSFTLSTGDVQICPESEQVARYAVGAVLEAVDAVMQGSAKNAFCIVRPPGHHATSNQGMGFCLFNNVAIGARYVCQKYGLKKILIVDWDVHHGNGTQDIFYDDPKVFYFSTHNGRIYPGTGHANESGKDAGLGFTLNFPLDPYKNPRMAIKDVFQHILAEKMKDFQPELVFISAGFDAHERDPLGGFNLTTKDFEELTEIVKDIAETYSQGRLISVLEGGYDLAALAEVIPAHVAILEADRSVENKMSRTN